MLTDEKRNQLFAFGLFDLATGLVNSVDGSADPLDEQSTSEIVEYLRERLDNWRPSKGYSRLRDAAAKAYVKACLLEWKLRVKQQEDFLVSQR